MASENVFLMSAAIMGIFITFLYDILRIFRRVVPHGSFMVSMEDLCFWIYCAVEVFLLMYHESNGTLRWFAVAGALSGMLVYKKLVSPFFVKYASMLFGHIRKILLKVFGFLLKPVIVLFSKIRKKKMQAAVRAANRRAWIKHKLKKRLTLLVKLLKM